MNRTLKIFFACALGALLGTTVALSVNHNFWWLGLIAGFVAGYLSYEFKQVLMAISTAWKMVSSWRPDRVYWKNYIGFLIPTISFMMTVVIGVISLMMLLLAIQGEYSVEVAEYAIGFTTTVFLFCLCPIGAFALVECDSAEINKIKRILLLGNPVRIYLWLPLKFFFYLAPVFLWKHRLTIARATISGTVSVGRFFKYLLILIHSEERLLCGMDAAIGASIGYFCGNAIVGMFSGGIFGVLNYEILSRRVLKLVPIRNE